MNNEMNIINDNDYSVCCDSDVDNGDEELSCDEYVFSDE